MEPSLPAPDAAERLRTALRQSYRLRWEAECDDLVADLAGRGFPEPAP